MERRTAICFSTPEVGHFQRLRPLVAGLATGGFEVHVFTHRDFRAGVERAGGIFVDLFGPHPLEAADETSIPIPSRYVTFAAHYAEPICREAEALAPDVVVHGTFAVIGRVVADRLGVPSVHLCAGHDLVPERFVERLERDPSVRISERCRQAVETLRVRYGLADASPFSYLSTFSRELNLYCEPPEFLEPAHRAVFQPLRFYGSLPGDEELRRRPEGTLFFGDPADGRLKVYVSFGTIVWRYDAALAFSTLTALARAFAERDGVSALFSLGGIDLGADAIAALSHPNVRVERYVDQWLVLQQADLFVTHHGLSSTHEAIFHRVPMASYPFFWDQPGLARCCQRLGLAMPLLPSLRGELGVADVRAALQRFVRERGTMRAALEQARGWELATLAERPSIHRSIAELGRASGRGVWRRRTFAERADPAA